MPTSSPAMLNRPPPELPGLMLALVWIRVRFRMEPSLLWIETSRLRALMMPSVTVPLRLPRGLPTATTSSPTARALLSPTTAGVRPSASIFRTATSLAVSEPTTVAV